MCLTRNAALNGVLFLGALIATGQAASARAMPSSAFSQGDAAQQASQPPSSGPTYAETMAWLKDKIVNLGGYNYSEVTTFYNRYGSKRETGTLAVTFEVNQNEYCRFSYKPIYKPTGDAESGVAGLVDLDIYLQGLAVNSLGVKPFDLSAFAGAGTMAGNGPGERIDEVVNLGRPSYWQISGLHQNMNGKDHEILDDYNSLIFSDQEIALRVAKALNHAVDICGGKPAKPDLFELNQAPATAPAQQQVRGVPQESQMVQAPNQTGQGRLAALSDALQSMPGSSPNSLQSAASQQEANMRAVGNANAAAQQQAANARIAAQQAAVAQQIATQRVAVQQAAAAQLAAQQQVSQQGNRPPAPAGTGCTPINNLVRATSDWRTGQGAMDHEVVASFTNIATFTVSCTLHFHKNGTWDARNGSAFDLSSGSTLGGEPGGLWTIGADSAQVQYMCYRRNASDTQGNTCSDVPW